MEKPKKNGSWFWSGFRFKNDYEDLQGSLKRLRFKKQGGSDTDLFFQSALSVLDEAASWFVFKDRLRAPSGAVVGRWIPRFTAQQRLVSHSALQLTFKGFQNRWTKRSNKVW